MRQANWPGDSCRKINHYPTVIFYIELMDIYGVKVMTRRAESLSEGAEYEKGKRQHTCRLTNDSLSVHSLINPISYAATISRWFPDAWCQPTDRKSRPRSPVTCSIHNIFSIPGLLVHASISKSTRSSRYNLFIIKRTRQNNSSDFFTQAVE